MVASILTSVTTFVKTVNFSDIKKIPWVKNCQKVTFSDENYSIVKSSWVFDTFYPWFQGELSRYGISAWDKKFDCDDFAALFRVLCQVCHLKSAPSKTDGLGVGEVSYDKDETSPHAINVVLTDNGPIFIEPQSGKQLILTKNEENSIYRVRF